MARIILGLRGKLVTKEQPLFLSSLSDKKGFPMPQLEPGTNHPHWQRPIREQRMTKMANIVRRATLSNWEPNHH